MIGVFIKTGGLKKDVKKEGFEDGGIQITTCPVGSTQYINSEGDTNCCNGDIVNGECGGTNMCTLSPTSKSIISCSELMRREWRERTRRFCPRSMYNYFGTMARTTEAEGCSASRCNSNGSAPSDANSAKCTIYKTDELNYARVDSCVNIIDRDNMQCPEANATKQIVPMGRGRDGTLDPALLKCNYSPANDLSINLPVDCYDTNRYTRLIRYSNKNNATNLENMLSYINRNDLYNKDVMFCPASKAYYIDKTLPRQNTWGLPGAPVCPAAKACPPAPVCPTSKTDKLIDAASVGANKAKEMAKAGISNLRNRLRR
jgi:hypothetical protein